MLLRKKEEIETWLNKYLIKNYELISNEEYGYIVDVNTDVDLSCYQLDYLKVKFNVVNGSFNCSFNELISLKGCPKIVYGDFYCGGNLLTVKELKYLPNKVKGNFIYLCNNKELSNLQKINNFKELKEKVNEIFKIKEEQENLLKTINKEEFKKIKNNINKI